MIVFVRPKVKKKASPYEDAIRWIEMSTIRTSYLTLNCFYWIILCQSRKWSRLQDDPVIQISMMNINIYLRGL